MIDRMGPSTIEVPVAVVGLDEFRAAVQEIKAAATELGEAATINVSIHIGGEPHSLSDLALRVRDELVRQGRRTP